MFSSTLFWKVIPLREDSTLLKTGSLASDVPSVCEVLLVWPQLARRNRSRIGDVLSIVGYRVYGIRGLDKAEDLWFLAILCVMPYSISLFFFRDSTNLIYPFNVFFASSINMNPFFRRSLLINSKS